MVHLGPKQQTIAIHKRPYLLRLVLLLQGQRWRRGRLLLLGLGLGDLHARRYDVVFVLAVDAERGRGLAGKVTQGTPEKDFAIQRC